MKLTINQIRIVYNALVNLSGEQQVVKDGENTRVIVKPYNLSGKTIWNLAKNTRILEAQMKDFNQTRDTIIRRLADGKDAIDKNDVETIKKYNLEMEELGKTEVDLPGLLAIKQADLNLDENKIHHTLLCDLMPILEE